MASPILILLGIGGIYMEFKTPGFGIGGIVAIAAFALFFFGNNIAGNLAGYETAALLVLGIVLLCVEFFVIPGTFIAAIAGGVCIFLALFGGMVSSWEWDHIIRDGQWDDINTLAAVLGIPLLKLALGPDRRLPSDCPADEIPPGFHPDAPRYQRHGQRRFRRGSGQYRARSGRRPRERRHGAETQWKSHDSWRNMRGFLSTRHTD